MLNYNEPHLNERLEIAKAKAKAIIKNEISSIEELTILYRFLLSRRYNLPVFHSYFENRTIDELAFEVFMHIEYDKLNDPSEAAKEAQKTIEEGNSPEMWDDLEQLINEPQD
jgi:hypothetical protein